MLDAILWTVSLSFSISVTKCNKSCCCKKKKIKKKKQIKNFWQRRRKDFNMIEWLVYTLISGNISIQNTEFHHFVGRFYVLERINWLETWRWWNENECVRTFFAGEFKEQNKKKKELWFPTKFTSNHLTTNKIGFFFPCQFFVDSFCSLVGWVAWNVWVPVLAIDKDVNARPDWKVVTKKRTENPQKQPRKDGNNLNNWNIPQG